jgi:hypothetical protein
MKLGDILIVIGAVLVAFALAGQVIESRGFRYDTGPDGFIYTITFAVGIGLLSSGLLSNHRRRSS